MGIQTHSQVNRSQTDYNVLKRAFNKEITNTSVRSPRTPTVIFKAIDALNLKFSGKINEKAINPFPEQYFTCGVYCDSCQDRCEQSMGHTMEGKPHRNSKACRYQHQYENKVFLCRQCHQNGREVCTIKNFICYKLGQCITKLHTISCSNNSVHYLVVRT